MLQLNLYFIGIVPVINLCFQCFIVVFPLVYNPFLFLLFLLHLLFLLSFSLTVHSITLPIIYLQYNIMIHFVITFRIILDLLPPAFILLRRRKEPTPTNKLPRPIHSLHPLEHTIVPEPLALGHSGFYHHNIFLCDSLHLGIKGENPPEVNKS